MKIRTLIFALMMAAVLGFAQEKAEAKSRPATAKVSLPTVTPDNLKKVIASYKGRPVMVNFWATWCALCRHEFPALVKVQKNYARRGLVVIFVSVDEPEDRAKAAKFLREQRAGGKHYVAAGDPLAFLPKFDARITEVVNLPRTYIYNKQGRLVNTYVGKALTYGQFSGIIKPHL